MHAPEVHRSAVMSQEPQAPPAGPQYVVDGVSQFDPEQQPAHEVGSHVHAPPEHSWPVVHADAPPHVHAPAVEHALPVLAQSTHVVPGAPHVDAESVVHMDVAASQQPSGQELASQTHTPIKHS
jgi:hypothetical protein